MLGATAASVAALGLLLGGCGSQEGGQGDGDDGKPDVTALEVEAPLRAPSWNPGQETIFALRQDGGALVKVVGLRRGGGVDLGADRPEVGTTEQELESVAGENLALETGHKPDKVYVPLPGKDEVFVSEEDDLEMVQTFGAGDSPARVALDLVPGRGDTLFALSEDGSTVTAIGLALKEVVAEVAVGGDEDSLIEAGAGGGFWLTGPDALALHHGPSLGRRAALELDAEALAADPDRRRAYAAEANSAGSGRVVAVEPGEGGGLEVVAEAEVRGRVTHLAADEGRLYALSPGQLIVLDAGNLETLHTVDFGESLERKALGRAAPSGLAVGEDHVYVALDGEPFLVRVEKP